ncbi:predicted protein [Plenodomus lingam JN3]|uniref:Uncharacterized protein n=1 Tax=Leptosphaeria maculans (strain JN3 / isolate v23.1.3 / race Av1-4-5-6-7-8) TaxID=985895 RepID=E5A666_LEPMJ|nr:predicted protein [Plenodomus lingam JN3]CBX99111.1 predicted protein [Plenodomus lingam JN3]
MWKNVGSISAAGRAGTAQPGEDEKRSMEVETDHDPPPATLSSLVYARALMYSESDSLHTLLFNHSLSSLISWYS